MCSNIYIFLPRAIIEITRREITDLRLNQMSLVVAGTSKCSQVVLAESVFMCNFESKPVGHG